MKLRIIWIQKEYLLEFNMLNTLESLFNLARERKKSPIDDSYTNKLYRSGMNKMAQKVGEEAVELVIEAKDDNADLFKEEAADLLYHMLILLKAKGFSLEDIEEVLYERANSK